MIKWIINKLKTKSIPCKIYPIVGENKTCIATYISKGDYQIFFKKPLVGKYFINFSGNESIYRYKKDILNENN